MKMYYLEEPITRLLAPAERNLVHAVEALRALDIEAPTIEAHLMCSFRQQETIQEATQWLLSVLVYELRRHAQ